MENVTNPNFLSINTLNGHEVVNRAKEDRGKIEDLMIDLENDRIAYVVLSFGGFLGMCDKFFAVPWRAIELRLYEHTLILTLNVDKEILKGADGIDKDKLPLMNEELFNLYTHYVYEPYWQIYQQ